MSLPDRNAPWPTIVKYFTKQKKDGENLAAVLKRASAYRKTGKITATGGNATVARRNTRKNQSRKQRTSNKKDRQTGAGTPMKHTWSRKDKK